MEWLRRELWQPFFPTALLAGAWGALRQRPDFGVFLVAGALTGVLNQAGHPDINIYGDRLIVLAWVLPVVGLPLLLEQVVRPRVRGSTRCRAHLGRTRGRTPRWTPGRAPDWTPESLDEVKFGKAVGFDGHIRQMTRTAQTEVGLPVRRTARGATALRGGTPWHPTPYQVFGGLFWLVLCLASWRVPMCCDFGQHAAVVERLKANLLHPAHPTADLPGEGSPFYSPYTVAQGAFARLTGLAGWEVVRLSAPLNLWVLLTGIGRFVRVLAPRRPGHRCARCSRWCCCGAPSGLGRAATSD